MDEAHKELVKRLRDRREYQSRGHGEVVDVADGDCADAADALEALAGEVVAARKHGKLLNKMLGEAEAERDRLKAALEGIASAGECILFSEGGAAQLAEDAREALGDAAGDGR